MIYLKVGLVSVKQLKLLLLKLCFFSIQTKHLRGYEFSIKPIGLSALTLNLDH